MSMRATRAMTVKEFRQLGRDHRTLALLIFQPLLLLVVFGYAASFDITTVSVGIYGAGQQAGTLMEGLPESFDVVVAAPDLGRDAAEEAMRGGDHVVAIVAGDPPVVLVDGSQLFAARAVVSQLQRTPLADAVEVLFNPDLETPPVLVPALAGLVLAFIGTIATSLGVVRERQGGTIEQLAVMPFRPHDILIGKVAPYLLVALVDLGLVVGASVVVFDVPFNGSVWPFLVGSLLFLMVTLGLGLFVSTVSENQGQAMQLSLMMTLPQVLLSGAIFPVASMAAGIRWIAYILPLTWFVELARGVMLRAATWSQLQVPLLALVGLGVVIFGLSILRVRRDLVPARSAQPPAAVAAEVGA
jgi:ABC-2 type transport system permease protein